MIESLWKFSAKIWQHVYYITEAFVPLKCHINSTDIHTCSMSWLSFHVNDLFCNSWKECRIDLHVINCYSGLTVEGERYSFLAWCLGLANTIPDSFRAFVKAIAHRPSVYTWNELSGTLLAPFLS